MLNKLKVIFNLYKIKIIIIYNLLLTFLISASLLLNNL